MIYDNSTMDSGRSGTAASRRPTSALAAAMVAAFVLLVRTSSSVWAQRSQGVEVENMRVGFDASCSTLKASNSFKVGTWTPVSVQLREGSEPWSRDHGSECRRRRRNANGVSHAGGGRGQPERAIQRLTHVPVRASPSSRSGCSIKMGGRLDEHHKTSHAARSRVDHAKRNDDPHHGATAGSRVDQRSAWLPVRGSGVWSQRRGRDSDRTTRPSGRHDARHWYGYDAAQAVVIDTADRDTLLALDALRGQPLVDWVAHGGHLVVSVGANWQAVRDSVLAPILPGLPSGLEKVASLEALDFFAGSNKSITPPGTPAVMVTKLEELEERGGTILSMMSKMPLVVHSAHGFGRVTLIAIDVDQKPFSDWVDRPLFWVRAIDLKHRAGSRTGPAITWAAGRRFISMESPTCRASSAALWISSRG